MSSLGLFKQSKSTGSAWTASLKISGGSSNAHPKMAIVLQPGHYAVALLGRLRMAEEWLFESILWGMSHHFEDTMFPCHPNVRLVYPYVIQQRQEQD
jgi:hypothetical protein